jgi:hypothetical protein
VSTFSDQFKSIVGGLAPTVATALGGPFAGMAVSALTKALGLDPGTSQKTVEDAVIAANPETLAKVKLAEIEFQQHLADLGIQEEQLAYADTDSARKREESVKDYTPSLLAVGITLGFFGVLAYMMVVGKPKENGDALLVMLGSLGTAWAAVVSYYFGSSASSTTKNSIIASLSTRK